MKKLFAIIGLVVISVASFAQISNLSPFTKEIVETIDGKDSTIVVRDNSLVIDNIYAGMLGGTLFSIDSLNATGFTGVRFGAMATYKPLDWLSFTSWGLVQLDPGLDPWSLQQFLMTIRPTKKWSLQFGSMATIPTEMRPLPVSAAGQFETWSQSQIPGGAIGFKTKYQLTDNWEFAGGVAFRSGDPEYSARVTYKKIQISGWYSTCDSISASGVAASVVHGRLSSTFVYKPDHTIADVIVFKVSKKHDVSIYSDMGYSFAEKELVRGEWGLLKSFDSQWINGLFGLGYRHEARSIAGYLFVHL